MLLLHFLRSPYLYGQDELAVLPDFYRIHTKGEAYGTRGLKGKGYEVWIWHDFIHLLEFLI